MSFVLRFTDSDGTKRYTRGRSNTADDLQCARVYVRKCDAGNSKWLGMKDPEIVEVNIIEVPK